MVSKITLFEPHFDGAQIGPAALGIDPSSEEQAGEAETETSGSGIGAAAPVFSHLPRARTVIGTGMVAAGLLAGVVVWRRFRARKDSDAPQTEGDADPEDEPLIEERPVEDLTAE